jgi:DNA repair ATPase RecN
MFKSLLEEHDHKKTDLRAKAFAHKKAMQELAPQLTSDILRSVDFEVRQMHDNQRRIEKEAKLFKEEIAKINALSKKWVATYDALNDSLKELGDVANWANVIERDMQAICNAVSALSLVNDTP